MVAISIITHKPSNLVPLNMVHLKGRLLYSIQLPVHDLSVMAAMGTRHHIAPHCHLVMQQLLLQARVVDSVLFRM
jgi:hypothetical protein